MAGKAIICYVSITIRHQPGASVLVAQLQIQLPVNGLGKAAQDGPSVWDHAPMWKT